MYLLNVGMMKAPILTYLSILLLCIGVVMPVSTYAAERVAFKRADSRTTLYQLILSDMRDKEAAHVMKWQPSGYKPYIEIYEVDLNKDGGKEILAHFTDRIGDGPPQELPPLVVYAQQNNRLRRLGEFKTWGHVQISDETTNGVRDLFIFENMKNQYQYTVYSYNVDTGTYERKQKAQ